MLGQVYSTNAKKLFCSIVTLFLGFKGLYINHSPMPFWVRSRRACKVPFQARPGDVKKRQFLQLGYSNSWGAVNRNGVK